VVASSGVLNSMAFSTMTAASFFAVLQVAAILLVWTTIIGTMIVVWRYYRWVVVAQVPYLIWVSLATVLQLSITWMNWGR
jgi:tryptophan-rich sensory protein